VLFLRAQGLFLFFYSFDSKTFHPLFLVASYIINKKQVQLHSRPDGKEILADRNEVFLHGQDPAYAPSVLCDVVRQIGEPLRHFLRVMAGEADPHRIPHMRYATALFGLLLLLF
jgi:hypothetical protein